MNAEALHALVQTGSGLLLLAGFLLWLKLFAAGRPDNAWKEFLPRLRTLPGAGATSWPLLAVLAWSQMPLFLTLGRPRSIPAASSISNTGLFLSPLIQYGAFWIVGMLALRSAGLHGRQLTSSPRRTARENGNLPSPPSGRQETYPFLQAWRWGLQGFVLMLPAVWLLSVLSAYLFARLQWPMEPQETLQWLTQPDFGLGRKFWLAGLALGVAPVAEEMFFRGVLLPSLARQGSPRRALVLTSLLFALCHQNAAAVLPLFGVAMACGLGYAGSGRLQTPILMHALFNAAGLATALSGAGG